MKKQIPTPEKQPFNNECPFCKSKEISIHGETIGKNTVYLCEKCSMIFSIEPEGKKWVHSKKAEQLSDGTIVIS